jgi:tetratricopeptide (TPR) repeat protein
MASTLNNLAEVTRVQGDLAAAKAYYDESLMLYRQVGDAAAAASVMGHIATILLQQGEYAQARELYEASYAIAQELGSKPGLRQTLNGLGNVARMQRRYGEAKQYYRQSLMLAAEIQNVGGMTLGLFSLAKIAWAEERAERVAVLMGAAAALNQSAHTAPDPNESAEFESLLALVRAALDAATFKAAWERGRQLSLEQAAAVALEEA